MTRAMGGDYELNANSPYKNSGTDGKDLGADIAGLDSRPRRSRIGSKPIWATEVRGAPRTFFLHCKIRYGALPTPAEHSPAA